MRALGSPADETAQPVTLSRPRDGHVPPSLAECQNHVVPRSRIRSVRAAAALVQQAGIALVFPARDLPFTSLWEAVIGTPEMTIFATDELGKKHLTPELDQVWLLKNRLAEQGLACVGKHVRGRLALISPDVLPALYALTGLPGHLDDFRRVSSLSPLELRLAEALLESGPLTAPELRLVIGGANARSTKRALDNLQGQLLTTQLGEADQDQGWPAAVFDLLARRYSEWLRSLPSPDEARTQLITTLGAPQSAALRIRHGPLHLP